MVRFPYFRMIWIPAVAGIPLFCSLYGWVHAASIIIAPPVARVEGGEVQLVRISLQAPQPLKVEQYKRIVFEGIPQSSRGAETQVGFTVGQNLPLVIRPKGF